MEFLYEKMYHSQAVRCQLPRRLRPESALFSLNITAIFTLSPFLTERV
jgi:hypothetical protein